LGGKLWLVVHGRLLQKGGQRTAGRYRVRTLSGGYDLPEDLPRPRREAVPAALAGRPAFR
jgi:hypothetical protein